MRQQEAEAARRREQVAREREQRDRYYNQNLYNAVHGAGPNASELQMNASQFGEVRGKILTEIGLKDSDAATLVRFIYANYPPKGKIRTTADSIAQIQNLQRQRDPDSKKRLKMLLLKVIQDYHPDKVGHELTTNWKTISEDIVKRVTKYYEGLK